jgi:hypothetical protein
MAEERVINEMKRAKPHGWRLLIWTSNVIGLMGNALENEETTRQQADAAIKE